MNCVRHETASAVGACPMCGRGVCSDCVSETDAACSDVCRTRLERGQWISETVYARMTAVPSGMTAVAYAVVGLVMIVAGGWVMIGNEGLGVAVLLCGMASGVIGMTTLKRHEAMKKLVAPGETTTVA
ncbi:MAG: hypothetical protein JWM98_79 [Thermoleophilia bacterium]|nr:hypothetical protein [Thermoleophilia bacterium]